jgi:hypothetical protein
MSSVRCPADIARRSAEALARRDSPLRRLPARDFRATARGRAQEGARDVPPLSQGGLHDRDRILARAARRSYRIHGAAASQRGLKHGRSASAARRATRAALRPDALRLDDVEDCPVGRVDDQHQVAERRVLVWAHHRYPPGQLRRQRMESDRRRHHPVERRLESGRQCCDGARPPAQPLPDQVLLRARQYEVIGDPQWSTRSSGPCQTAAAKQHCGDNTAPANKVHAMPEPSGLRGINPGAAAGFHDKLVIHSTAVKRAACSPRREPQVGLAAAGRGKTR